MQSHSIQSSIRPSIKSPQKCKKRRAYTRLKNVPINTAPKVLSSAGKLGRRANGLTGGLSGGDSASDMTSEQQREVNSGRETSLSWRFDNEFDDGVFAMMRRRTMRRTKKVERCREVKGRGKDCVSVDKTASAWPQLLGVTASAARWEHGGRGTLAIRHLCLSPDCLLSTTCV